MQNLHKSQSKTKKSFIHVLKNPYKISSRCTQNSLEMLSDKRDWTTWEKWNWIWQIEFFFEVLQTVVPYNRPYTMIWYYRRWIQYLHAWLSIYWTSYCTHERFYRYIHGLLLLLAPLALARSFSLEVGPIRLQGGKSIAFFERVL